MLGSREKWTKMYAVPWKSIPELSYQEKCTYM